MKDTKKKAVESKTKNVTYAQNRIWKNEDLKKYRAYQQDFAKTRYRTFVIRIPREEMSEMVEYLESKDNLTRYIADLISKDIAKNKKATS